MYEYGIDVKKKVNNHFFFLVLQINLNLAVSKKQNHTLANKLKLSHYLHFFSSYKSQSTNELL